MYQNPLHLLQFKQSSLADSLLERQVNVKNNIPVCVSLNDYVHDVLFSFAGRAFSEGYFTVYQLDDGTRETRLCKFPVTPEGKYLTHYVEEQVQSLEERGRKLTAFAMFLSQEGDGGLYQWYSLATDDQVNLNAMRYVPFINDDGIFDYMAVIATPDCEEDKAAMRPMFEATDCVWQMAQEHNAAIIDLVTTNSEPVLS